MHTPITISTVAAMLTAVLVGCGTSQLDGWDRAECLINHPDKPWLALMLSESPNGPLQLPGGHVNPDETADVAAVREVSEELGVVVAVDGIVSGRVDADGVSTIRLRCALTPPNQRLQPDKQDVFNIQWGEPSNE